MAFRISSVMGTIGLLFACNNDYDLTPGTDIPDEPDSDAEFDGGGVRGRICAPNEQSWIAGADVWIDHEFGRATTTTDADGYFTLTGVPDGTYTVNVEKGAFTTTFEVTITAGEILVLEEDQCIQDHEVRIAVITGTYDSIEHVLDRLGITYTVIAGGNADVYGPGSSLGDGQTAYSFLSNAAQLAQYDILFFNCGMNDAWTSVDRAGISQNLRDFVANGGSIYASDWAHFAVEGPFPSFVDFIGDDNDAVAPRVGMDGSYTGVVRDPAIASALGSTSASLYFDLPIWAAMQAAGNSGDVMIEGNFRYNEDPWGFNPDQSLYGPLAVKTRSFGGTVLYTTFHNEAQTTRDMDVILQEIIFHL